MKIFKDNFVGKIIFIKDGKKSFITSDFENFYICSLTNVYLGDTHKTYHDLEIKLLENDIFPSICLSFLNGVCKMGGQCKYLHIIDYNLLEIINTCCFSCIPQQIKDVIPKILDEDAIGKRIYIECNNIYYPIDKEMILPNNYVIGLVKRTKEVIINSRKICVKHLEKGCFYHNLCNYVHICYDFIKDEKNKDLEIEMIKMMKKDHVHETKDDFILIKQYDLEKKSDIFSTHLKGQKYEGYKNELIVHAFKHFNHQDEDNYNIYDEMRLRYENSLRKSNISDLY